MKHVACLYALALLAASPAFAQSSSSSSAAPHFAPAPMPPGMNDPGVDPRKAPPPAAESSTAEPAVSPAELQPSHLQGKPIPMPKMPGAPAGADANGDAPPDVSVHQEGDNTIQEYRQNGKVYMVVVTPKFGPQQIYNVDPDGHMLNQNGQPPVKPVMYKIMQWGGSKPASASSSEDSGS
ncbi:DUF2782 domain-containing protein [Dyella acidiphila]|nr:DUF2782 domain-containing protein [Dyella acidiphila]